MTNHTIKTVILNVGLLFTVSLPAFSQGGIIPSTSHNYVLTKRPSTPVASKLALDMLPVKSQRATVDYYDGFGHRIQQVGVAQNPQGNDIVFLNSYDALGRASKMFLPYAVAGNMGGFRKNDLGQGYFMSEHFSFYKKSDGGNGNVDIADSDFPFSERRYDGTPENKLVEQGYAGDAWQLSSPSIANSGHTMKKWEKSNEPNSVIKWIINDEGELSQNGFYAEGTLFVQCIANENYSEQKGLINSTEEFFDSFGNKILERKYLEDGTDLDSNLDIVDTYYVYDLMNRLRVVIPPQALADLSNKQIKWIDSSVNTSNAYNGVNLVLVEEGGEVTLKSGFSYKAAVGKSISIKANSGMTFRYDYDARGRLIEFKQPGAAPVYYVYDSKDRLVLSQNGNQREHNQWIFIKYDIFDRPVLTGVYTHPSFSSPETMAQVISSFYSNPNSAMSEEEGGNVLGYTNRSFPSYNTTEPYLTVVYYDDYSNITALNGFGNLAFMPQPNFISYEKGMEYCAGVQNLVTGQKAKVLDGNEHTSNAQWMCSVVYYDDYNRPIQTRGNVYDGSTNGVITTSTRYQFSGLIDAVKEQQLFNGTVFERQLSYIYDHAGRLLTTSHKITGDSQGEVQLSSYAYNALGQLVSNKMGKVESGVFSSNLQEVNYTYNIRGWLTGINNPEDMRDDLFAMQLCYDNAESLHGLTNQSQYNGNISGIIVNRRVSGTKYQNEKYAYGYTYDGLSRLASSEYGEGDNFSTNKGKYKEYDIRYDLNGNIKSMKRNGNGLIDDLYYNYSGNQLQSVTDIASTSVGFVDRSGTDYSYDANGNLVRDGNKGISTISYNYLNLPQTISVGTDKYIRYIYDANGNKLCKEFKDGTNSVNKHFYAGALEYDNNKNLRLIHTAEGQVEVTGTGSSRSYAYNYLLRDYLGNTRAMFTNGGLQASLMQVADYYPFGSQHLPSRLGHDNKFLYNGKEFSDELGLDWYDLGWRMYDPKLGRFHALDPMAHAREWASPYSFVQNNPINRIDPNGAYDEMWYDDDINDYGIEREPEVPLLKRDLEPVICKPDYYTPNDRPAEYLEYLDELYETDPPAQGQDVQYAGIEGGEHFIGPLLILLGQPLKALKPVGALGSKPGSSIASYTLSKAFPQTFTKVLGKQTGTKIATSLGTNVIGRAAGRFVPYAGWVLTGWDVGWYLGENYGPSKWFTPEPPKSVLLEYMRENGMLDE